MPEYNQEENNDLIGEEVRNFETSGNNLEDLLDLIAIALIESELVDTSTVENNQKFIRNGQLQSDSEGGGVLALFQKDIKANQEDSNTFNDTGVNLEEIANQIVNFNSLLISINPGTDNSVSITIEGGGLIGLTDITEFLVQDGTFSNVSQFIPLSQQQSNVDIDKANEFLDTNIFELLPTGDARQQRIIRFFQELNTLLPPNLPEFDLDDNGRVDREEGTNNWEGANQYSQNNSISYAQDNQDGNIDEEDAFIHRLTDTANDTNSTRTIEEIYNTILPYLTDILEDDIDLVDDRPEYKNQSDGYIKFRNLNQGIIIRNTNQDFIEGLNPNNPTYLTTGFTISMWVRFLDKTSQGTLFNFGNPLRGVFEGTPSADAFGFKLETYVLNKDDVSPYANMVEPTISYATWSDLSAEASYNNSSVIFNNSNTARFVRLVVNDNGQLRDSHVGGDGLTDGYGPFQKLNTTIPLLDYSLNYEDNYASRLLNTTFIPENTNEWYFINATFNPFINEGESHDMITEGNAYYGNSITESTPDYWMNHISLDENGNLISTANSGLGNRCKVEIISKTDLLRARGFKV